MSADSHDLDTLAIHAGQAPDPVHGAVMPPIVLASTFAQRSPGEHTGFEYARTDNPTRRTLEKCIAALEHGADGDAADGKGAHGIAFSSGCAAMTTIFQTLSPGDRVVSCDDVYGGTHRILERVMKGFGIETTWVDMTDEAATDAALALPDAKLVWIETPTNPLLKVIDVASVAERAKAKGLQVVVDNTFATPAQQRPLDLGADVVVHSTTKYLNGHSDVVGGCLVTRDAALAERFRFLQNAVGAVPSPFDCFLVLRGIKTLGVRVRRSAESAAGLAGWLEGEAGVTRVIYPGLASHPQHAVAASQMSGFGGMISVELVGGLEAARRFLETTRIFTLAESLGGVESLIEHPAIMTHGAVPEAKREALGISAGLIRLSVGLEGPGDLRRDLEAALAAARG
ncbi:MAG: PLP-dependent aspartate aminotransferase family protein [Myxococcota bacterium]